MKSQQQEVTDLVEKEVAFMERMKADADKTATALIQSYLGPDPRYRHGEVPLPAKPRSQGSPRAAYKSTECSSGARQLLTLFGGCHG
jgi:hypothetical protein